MTTINNNSQEEQINIVKDEFILIQIKGKEGEITEAIVHNSTPHFVFKILKHTDELDFQLSLKFLGESWSYVYFKEHLIILLYTECLTNIGGREVTNKFNQKEFIKAFNRVGIWYKKYHLDKDSKGCDKPCVSHWNNTFGSTLVPELYLGAYQKMITKYMAINPSKIEKLEIKFQNPDNGIVDMIVSVNGEEKTYISLDKLKHPFVEIKKWLEHIVNNSILQSYNGLHLNLDNNGYTASIGYDPFPWIEKNGEFEDDTERSYGVFFIYDELTQSIRASAYCKTSEFVKMMYQTTKTFYDKKIKNQSLYKTIIMHDQKHNNKQKKLQCFEEAEHMMFESSIIELYIQDEDSSQTI